MGVCCQSRQWVGYTVNAAAWKDERVWAVVTDNGQFQIAAKRRGDYRLPFHNGIIARGKSQRFDLDQAVRFGPRATPQMCRGIGGLIQVKRFGSLKGNLVITLPGLKG